MAYLGGGLPVSTFGKIFLNWWDEKIFVIKDYPYEIKNFKHD